MRADARVISKDESRHTSCGLRGCQTGWNGSTDFFILESVNATLLTPPTGQASPCQATLLALPLERSSLSYSCASTPWSPWSLCTIVTFSVNPLLINLFKTALCPSSSPNPQQLSILFLAVCILDIESPHARKQMSMSFLLVCLLMHFRHRDWASHVISDQIFLNKLMNVNTKRKKLKDI